MTPKATILYWMKRLFLATAVLFSCDSGTPEFRDVGDTWNMVLVGDLETFDKVLNTCTIDAKLTIVLSGVLPPPNAENHDITFAFSMHAPSAVANCMRNAMADNGAEF